MTDSVAAPFSLLPHSAFVSPQCLQGPTFRNLKLEREARTFWFRLDASHAGDVLNRLGNWDAKVGEILCSPLLQWAGKR